MSENATLGTKASRTAARRPLALQTTHTVTYPVKGAAVPIAVAAPPARTTPKNADDIVPPMIFVVLVIAEAIPVRPRGAAAAAAAGIAAMRAPAPTPATPRLTSTCQGSSWRGRSRPYPMPTRTAAPMSETRGLVRREVTAKSTAPTISESR